MAEHADQVLLQAHHQRVHPGIKDHVGPLPTHLGRIAGRHILHMQRRADHGAGDAQALGAVALHLGTQHQFRCRCRHRRLHGEVIVCDQGLQAQPSRRRPHLPGQLPAVGTQTHHLETQLLAGDAGCGDGVGGVSENEYPLGREVGGIHRAGIPGQAGAPFGLAHPIGAGFQLGRQFQPEQGV